MGAEPRAADPVRASALQEASQLEYLTLGWNVVEAVVALFAASAAGSLALLGFGLDSVVESASAGVLIWRLHRERASPEGADVRALEARAQRLVAISLVLLALLVGTQAVRSLLAGTRPGESFVGIGLTSLSLVVMWWLSRRKYGVAERLGSGSMRADAFQTDACFWISLIVLVGVLANATLGWWFADSAAALGLCVFVLREAREVWEGEQVYEDL